MHNFFLHKNILIFRRFFNSANRYNYIYQQQNAIYNNVVWHFYADGCKAEMADEKNK